MSDINLPVAPTTYDPTDQRATRAEIERVAKLGWRSGADLKLLRGERLFQTFAHGIVAHSGGGQAAATPLTARINHVGTVAAAGDSVALMPAKAGLMQTVIVQAANAPQVFGTGADTVNGAAAATGISQAAGTTVTYHCPQAGLWFG
jgi:hypothetical protein